MMRFFQIIVYEALLLIVCVVLLFRFWPLRLLVFNPLVREEVRTSLEQVTLARGWLLSDVEITGLTEHQVRMFHRRHLRGDDPLQCYYLTLSSDTLTPCEPS